MCHMVRAKLVCMTDPIIYKQLYYMGLFIGFLISVWLTSLAISKVRTYKSKGVYRRDNSAFYVGVDIAMILFVSAIALLTIVQTVGSYLANR